MLIFFHLKRHFLIDACIGLLLILISATENLINCKHFFLVRASAPSGGSETQQYISELGKLLDNPFIAGLLQQEPFKIELIP